jgi:hypothetical protein
MLTTNKAKKKIKPVTLDDNSIYWLVFIIALLIGFGTRLYKVDEPDHVW